MKNKYYDKKYFEERNHLDLHLAESIKVLMEDYELKKILDVGCGTGKLVKFFNEQGFNATGCDNSKIAIKAAKKLDEESFVVASATKLPFKKGSFDLVISISTIEHLTINEAKLFLKEAFRVLKPHGFLFLVTPNFSSPMRYILQDKWFGYSDPTHVTFFTPSSLSQLLQQYGFGDSKLRLKSAYNVSTDLHVPSLLKKLPMPMKNLLNYLMISSPLSTWRDSFWIAAEKKEIPVTTVLKTGR